MLRWEVTLLEKLPGLGESCVPSEPPGGVLDDVSDETELREAPEEDALSLELNPLPSAEPEVKPPRSQGLSDAANSSSSFTASSSVLSS